MKAKKLLCIFLIALTIFSIFAVDVSALSWDGASAGGSSSAVNGSNTGYVIRSTDDSCCVVGYRFSVVDSSGAMKSNKVIDVFRKTSNGNNAYSTSAKFSTKYNKKQLIANKDSKLKTTENTTNCFKESSMGFASDLPNPGSVGTWQKYEANINSVLSKIGLGSVSKLSYGDKVIIEPLFDVCLAGEYQALTITEIAYCGRSVLGGSSTGGASSSTSKTWGFIKNYTNRYWPNKLYTPDGQGLWTAASALSENASFNTILTKGYGAGIAYTESKAPVLTICFDCYGTSPTFTDTSKGFKFGSYNRICTTTEKNKTIAGTANVYYQALSYNNQLGENGLHDFSTFGLSAPTGYKFKAWKGAKGEFDQSTRYTASQLSDDIKNGDTYEWLSATFSPITYTVKYNGNGSTSGSTASSTHTYDTAKNLTANGFTKTGYTFKGWNTKADGSGTSYTNSQSVKNLSSTQGATINLYAQWTGYELTLCYDCYGSNVTSNGTTTDYKLGSYNRITSTTKKNKTIAGTSNVLYHTVYYNNKLGGTGLYNFSTFGLNPPTGYKFTSWLGNGKSFDQDVTTYKASDFSSKISSSNDTVWLSAQFSPITYTVKYNGNGNTGGSTASSTHTYDMAKNLTANGFTKTGYTFKGWNTKADGSGTSYTNSQSVKNLSSTQGATINLYAQWTPVTYTVAYNANGGSGAPSSQTKTYGVNLTLSSTKPTRSGYTFLNWNTKADGSGTTYYSGGTYSANASVTLYAQWTANVTYTVSYNANGGTGAPSSQTKAQDVSLTLSSTKPTRTGYTFKNWNTKSDGSGSTYTSGGTYTANASVTLYAQWTPITYTVSYNANGGSNAPTSQTKTYGVNLTLSSTKPTRTGYTFVNWNTKADGSGTTYSSGGTYSANANVSLYAQWTPITYKIVFDGNYATSGSTASMIMTYNVAKNLTANGFVKTSFVFNSWNTKADGSGVSYSDKQSVNNLTTTNGATVTLYAQWDLAQYTINYLGNTSTSGSMPSQIVFRDVEVSISANEYRKTGYSFVNWNTKADGSGITYSANQKGTNLAENKGSLNLYAQWSPIKYTVSYNANGGSGAPASQTKTYGVNLTLSSVKPTRTGYTFVNWNTKADGSGTSYSSGGAYTSNASVTLYAQWTPITYTVAYYANGGSNAPASQTKIYGVDLTLSTTKPIRTDYTFKNWNTKSDGSGKTYNSGDIYTANASVVLYAQWEQECNLSLQAITPNAAYREGTDVISSFNLVNTGIKPCVPDDNISVRFKVYKSSTVIKTVTLSKVVVPANDKNLLYFKWTVPTNIGTDEIKITGEIIDGSSTYGLISKTYATCKYTVSATPDTQYEASAPSGFSVPAKPTNSSGSTTWSVWSYENGAFKKTNYGIAINDVVPTITPDTSANATFSSGIWTMKSGYGFGISVNNTVKSVSGYTMPDSSDYTTPQYSKVLFPEFAYSATNGNYRTLELVSGSWMFRANGTYGRIHFTPLWYPDGQYSVSVVQQDCWTPAGMISRQVNSNNITISGSAYDDWYLN